MDGEEVKELVAGGVFVSEFCLYLEVTVEFEMWEDMLKL